MDGKKHVTTACTYCRRRKIKCDGKTPCSNCHAPNRMCVYNADEDKRRTSVRKATNELKFRLVQLERVLKAHNIEIPTSIHATPSNSGSAGCRGLRSLDNDNGSPQETSMDAIQHPIDTEGQGTAEHLQEQSTDDTTRDMANFPALEKAIHTHSTSDMVGTDFCNTIMGGVDEGYSIPQVCPPRQEDGLSSAAPDELLESLTNRIGSLQLAEDGQLRYYGPTSNLHICGNADQSLWRPAIRQVASEAAGILRQAGLDQPVSSKVEIHLAKLYFAWEDPAIHVVDELTFFAEKQNRFSGSNVAQYYSETLNNAICAFGACLATGEHLGVPEPAAEFFESRARALLEVELDSPTVATVQALVVMSAVEASLKRDTRGWLYSGMAARLSADLGLHLSVHGQVQNGILNQQDAQVRRTAFWGVYIHDKMWSLYLGRPSSASFRDISVSRPAVELDAVDNRVWKPYPPSNGQTGIPSDGLFYPLGSCTNANVTLCEFMRRILKTLYAERKVTAQGLSDFLYSTTQDLWKWKENLPSELQVETPSADRLYVPAVLQLHMQYYAVRIALLRPFLSQDPLYRNQHAVIDARAECIEAAHLAADVLRCYRKQYHFRQANVQIVHVVFTTSLIHIYSACTGGTAESRRAHEDLQICYQALLDMCQCYRSATRALEIMILVRTEWKKIATKQAVAGGLNSRSSARPASQTPNNDQPGVAFSQQSVDTTTGSRLFDVAANGEEDCSTWKVLDWADLGTDALFDPRPSNDPPRSLETMFTLGENLLRAYDVETSAI